MRKAPESPHWSVPFKEVAGMVSAWVNAPLRCGSFRISTVNKDWSCAKETEGLLYYSFASSALFFSSSSSNGNSSSWSSLGLEGDLYEDNLSFPTSDRLVQFRNLKPDESFTTNAWCHILKRMWVQCQYVSTCFSPISWHDSAW